MSIIDHIEKFFGNISQGWKEDESSSEVQVVSFENQPIEGVNALLTVGLSRHELVMPNRRAVRQELVFPVRCREVPKDLISFIFFVSELILHNHFGLLRGQVIRLERGIAERVGFDALYCAIPGFVDDEFNTFKGSNPPTVFVWIIPIFASEAEYVEINGWNAFEDVLEKKDPDLFFLKRLAIT